MARIASIPIALVALASALLATSCSRPLPGTSVRAEAPPSSLVPDERFGLGVLATADEIARWDRDVRPDGEGLPAGRGTVDAGRRLYAARCRHCHGADGRGGPFDRLAGRLPGDAFPFAEAPGTPRTIGSYWPWATTLFDYTRRAMPSDRPGSLSDQEVYDVTAYLLFLNGLLAEEATLDRSALLAIEMPARDRFIRDDRRGGRDVR